MRERAFGDGIARRVVRLRSAHVQLVVEVLQRPPDSLSIISMSSPSTSHISSDSESATLLHGIK